MDRWGSLVWHLLHHAEASVYQRTRPGVDTRRDLAYRNFIGTITSMMPAPFAGRAAREVHTFRTIVEYHNDVNRRLGRARYGGPTPQPRPEIEARLLVVVVVSFLALDRGAWDIGRLATAVERVCAVAPNFAGGAQARLTELLDIHAIYPRKPVDWEFRRALEPFRAHRTAAARNGVFNEQLLELMAFVAARFTHR